MKPDELPPSVLVAAIRHRRNRPLNVADLRVSINEKLQRVIAGEKHPPHPDSRTPKHKELANEINRRLDRIAQFPKRNP
jgi:hypothetical protein